MPHVNRYQIDQNTDRKHQFKSEAVDAYSGGAYSKGVYCINTELL